MTLIGAVLKASVTCGVGARAGDFIAAGLGEVFVTVIDSVVTELTAAVVVAATALGGGVALFRRGE